MSRTSSWAVNCLVTSGRCLSLAEKREGGRERNRAKNGTSILFIYFAKKGWFTQY